MKKFMTGLLAVFLMHFYAFPQADEASKLIEEGIALHDQGNYKEAIIVYEKALQLDPASYNGNYEIAYTFMALEEYDKAIAYGEKAISIDKEHPAAYIVLGSALDLNGDTKGSVKVYKKGLKYNPGHYLLHYNLALDYVNMGDYKNAEKSAIEALNNNLAHGSSHLLLGNLFHITKNRPKSLLSLYFFLLLEPNTSRSEEALKMLDKQLKAGVEKGEDNQINISIGNTKSKDGFGAVDLMVSLLAASRNLEKNENLTDAEFFVETNQSFFSIAGELNKKNDSFWWEFYVSFFYSMVKAGHVEAFSYYIQQTRNSEEVNKWLEANTDKVEALKQWMVE